MRKDSFLENIRRGREFEDMERSQWPRSEDVNVEFEALTQLKGKRGRIDIRLFNAEDGYVVVIELKATDWDRMMKHRVRPNALRHARQLWRYVETELDVRHHDVLPAIVYPVAPTALERKEEVETLLDERGIQVVWRAE